MSQVGAVAPEAGTRKGEGRGEELPVVVIGAGPVGLVAAAHLADRGVPFLLLESGLGVGTHLRDWGHVRLFTPWEYLVEPVSLRLLEATGWTPPDPARHPTGDELVESFLIPLSRVPAIARSLQTDQRVVRISRSAPEGGFLVEVEGTRGSLQVRARGVLDASGTWATPNPVGGAGQVLEGEDHPAIERGIPQVNGAQGQRFMGARVAVVGSGHSALHLLRELTGPAHRKAGTRVSWILRRGAGGGVYGGGEADGLPARGAMGRDVRAAVEAGWIQVADHFRTDRIVGRGPLELEAPGPNGARRRAGPFDRILVATGFHPDPRLTSGLELALDPVLEAPLGLAPMIDPAQHACGSVAPHGWQELAHPEPGYFALGARSYGRAPTFLLRTGYEQARSVVAHVAGDAEAARTRAWELPATGVCVTDRVEEPAVVGAAAPVSPCCGGCGCDA
jgi:hypothetical protein